MTNETMAEKVHDIWCSWMSYVFKSSLELSDGSFIIPRGLATRWKRQCETPYNKLPLEERASDIAIAQDILDLVKKKN